MWKRTSIKLFHSSVEYNSKEKTEGTNHQQTHRTQEWSNSYQRERDWGEGWEGRDKGNNGHYD